MDKDRRLRIALPECAKTVDNYVNALTLLGAEIGFADANCSVSAFDGLLLPGGADIDPVYYGQANTASEGIDLARDAQEFSLTDCFVKAKKPVFGICRGHQLLNVYFGGTLIQDLPTKERHSRMGGPADKIHGCIAAPDGFLAPLYGAQSRVNVHAQRGASGISEHMPSDGGGNFIVNSSHHQAVDRPGRGIRVAARADDGTVEALQHESLPVWAVQWHPERMCFAHRRPDTVDGSTVLRFFLEQCTAGCR